jgi:hypothetical protein
MNNTELTNSESTSTSTSPDTNDHTQTNSTLNLPPNKDTLLNSLTIIKNGLNTANKSKLIDLKTSVLLRNTMKNLNEIVNTVIKVYYKDNKLVQSPEQISTLNPQVIEDMLKLLVLTIENAQLNGVYDTIEESGLLYDSLLVIGNLLTSVLKYSNK